MAWRIVKQPNGLLARFSDVVDGFTHMNLTEQAAMTVCRQEGLETEDAERKVRGGVEDWIPWSIGVPGSGLDRWNDCMRTIERVHGKKRAEQLRKSAEKGSPS